MNGNGAQLGKQLSYRGNSWTRQERQKLCGKNSGKSGETEAEAVTTERKHQAN